MGWSGFPHVTFLLFLCFSYVLSDHERCTGGKVYTTCGTSCPLTCENYEGRDTRACAAVCVEGCFCPQQGTQNVVDFNGVCVTPADCPAPRVAVQCVGEELCPAYTSCRTNNATGVSACYPDCQVLNGGCPANLRCKVSRYSYGNDEDSDEDSDTEHSDSDDEDGGHGVGDSDEEGHGDEHDDDGSRGDGRDGDGHDGDDDDDDDFYSGSPIDYFPSCTEHPYVLCDGNNLQCDSEYTYCLKHNSTGEENCIPSCLSDNGGCEQDRVCITQLNDDHTTSLECLKSSDLSSECVAGQTINQCGDHCQQTCEQYVSGEPFYCLEYCGPPACTCPRGLLLFRDRCVDPRLCYILLQYPPAIDPLPILDGDEYLFSMFSPGSSPADFLEGRFLRAVRRVLASEGFSEITVELHGIYEDNGLQIVVKLSGDGLTVETSGQFASILSDNSDQYPLPVQQVSVVDAERIGGGFWTCTRIGLVSAGGTVACLLLVLLVVVLAVFYMKQGKKQLKRTHPDKLKVEAHNLIGDEELMEEKKVPL